MQSNRKPVFFPNDSSHEIEPVLPDEYPLEGMPGVNPFQIYCPDEILMEITKRLRLEEMRCVVQVDKRMKGIVENTPTSYKKHAADHRFGTYAEIRDAFQKRARVTLASEPSDMAKKFTEYKFSMLSTICGGVTGLASTATSGLTFIYTVIPEATVSAGVLTGIGIGVGAVACGIANAYACYKGHQFFSQHVKNEMAECERQKQDKETHFPKPVQITM